MNNDCQIRVLPDLLIRKIAAGEVVERPASVVKELLENALDADARRIAVTIEEGGKALIRVTDDGGGMTAEELRLAVTPHATSKLAREEDLFAIGTMGFRGEALASISSVSKMRLVSRREGTLEGHELRVTAEQVESSQAAGCPVGTTAEVRDLFFNVPARRKFLRAPSTETGQINEQLARVALANPQIAFELTNNGRVTQRLPVVKTRLERIAKFFSPELASALLTIERNERGVHLEAYAAPPAQSRATTQWQYAFVNGRYIRDRNIQHAVREAYRGLMEPNRHGVVFLFLTIDPQHVDVNVHPTKIEVRWTDARLIHSIALSALRDAFQRADLTPALRTDRAVDPVSPEEQERARREMADLLLRTPPIRPGSSNDPGPTPSRDPLVGAPDSSDPLASWRALYGTQNGAEPTSRNETPGESRPADVPTSAGAQLYRPPPRAIQMHNLYLVAESEDGIVIVDQHALHERILYEQLRERITRGPLEAQRLLLPETVNVTAQDIALLEEHAELLTRLGIEWTAFGADSVAVQSFPARLKDANVSAFMRDLLDYLSQKSGDTAADEVMDKVLSMMACKAAVKAGDSLTPQEIDALFAQRSLVDKAASCPHGRPTTLRLTKADLNRQFHRT